MLERMPARLLAEWQIFARMQPLLPAVQQHAEMMTLLANANRNRRERPNPFKVRDFLPSDVEDLEPKPAKELYQAFRTWAKLAGAKKT
jgi:hypothetical protein